MAERITAKEERFCQEYIIDYNATKAAIRAGYKERSAASQGSRLLKNAEVAARVRELGEQYNLTKCFNEKTRILKELWDVYERAMQKTPVMVWSQEVHAYVPSGEWAFDGKTATKAMELLMKMEGLMDGKKKDAGAEGESELKFFIEVKKTGDPLGTER